MARSLALTLALLLGALTLTDRFVCPDGCTDNTPVSFDCVLCHGFALTVIPLPDLPSELIARAGTLVTVIPASPAPRSIEHPPRA